MNSRSLKIAAAVVLLLVSSLCVGYFLSKPAVYAVGRVDLEHDPNAPHTNQFWLSAQLQGISNFLEMPETETVLAQSSTAKAGSVKLISVEPYRSTRLVLIQYQGFDSNEVWNVASNAAYLVGSRYATNQPATFLKYEDTAFWQPKSDWSKLVDRLSGLFE